MGGAPVCPASSVALLLLLCLAPSLPSTSAEEETGSAENKTGRGGRLFPIFQIVRFKNGPCVGATKNGTCYTAEECESRGGVNSGSCASGYGVCCVFSIYCGQTSMENCTYFESNKIYPGGCKATICPCGNDICQLRLDFNNFVITGPGIDSNTVLLTTAGVPFDMGDVAVSLQSQCLTDTFQVVGGGGNSNSDVLCGTLTGEHLYVEAEDASCCNDLVFQLGNDGFMGQTVASRQWSIKVTQYSCYFSNLAPTGCDQFFFGANTDMVRTFNYNNGNGRHLANQDQTICVRQENTMCRICWFAATATDVQLSGPIAGQGFNDGVMCCSYGDNGQNTMGYDCINIPGAEKAAATKAMVGSNLCGRSNGLVTSDVDAIAVDADNPEGNSKTICSRRTPFYIRFRSDNFEFVQQETSEGAAMDAGAMLTFFMDAINCN